MIENTVLRKILANAMKIKAQIEYQYCDYAENAWTIPRYVTPRLAEEILSDGSIKKVRLIIDANCL